MYEHRGYYEHASTMLTHGKKTKKTLYGCLSLSDKRRFTEWFFGKGSVNTVSGHPIGIIFSSAAKGVTFVNNLNLQFVFCCSWLHCSTISSFSKLPWIVIKSAFVHSKCDLSNKVFLFRVRSITNILPFLYYEDQIHRRYRFLQRNPAY